MNNEDAKKEIILPANKRKGKKTNIKKFSVPCIFGQQKSPFTIYVGNPKSDNHPLQNQSNWLSQSRGGSIPPEIMKSVEDLQKISKENKIPLADLILQALSAAAQQHAQENNEN